MEKNKGKIFLNNVVWGFVLWLIGYVLGIVFFAFVPKDQIGWYIKPIGVVATLWVLFKKAKRDEFTCYFGLGVIWTIMAAILDYIFIVKFFNSADYYKPDVYLYYILTFVLPVSVGIYRLAKGDFKQAKLK